MTKARLRPLYQRSWAICIGIDEYESAPQLSCAVNDAVQVAESLTVNLGFAQEDVIVLKNEDATRSGIMRAIEGLISNLDISSDDRVLFFFAGHGHTVTGIRGEKGYLVPSDGSAQTVSSLISWEQIVDIFEHCFAKHVLFILDACYSGLAIKPSVRSISQRYLRDLLTRPSRQVIASGMKDQTVADVGGTRDGHSIFTSSLLDIFDRTILEKESVVSATQAMSYLRNFVGGNDSSQQTPHFGSIHGDGDFLIHFPNIDTLVEEPEYAFVETLPQEMSSDEPVEERIREFKESLVDPSSAITLHESIVSEVRAFQTKLTEEFESCSARNWSDDIPETIVRFESLALDLAKIISVVGYWSGTAHVRTLQKFFSELFSPEYLPSGGNSFLVALSHYPAVLIVKAFSDACIAGENNEVFSRVMTHVVSYGFAKQPCPVIKAYSQAYLEINRANTFKRLEAHANNKVPTAERLFFILQPILNDSIFLSSEYQSVSLNSEVFLFLASALSISDVRPTGWGPPGRFTYKTHDHNYNESVLKDLQGEYEAKLDGWWPVKLRLIATEKDKIDAAFQKANEWASKNSW